MIGSPTTAYDVARLAGVSQTTVSRAFSGKAPVSLRTRQRIFEIAEHLGYQPNLLASGLRGGRTSSIGALWPFATYVGDGMIGTEVLRRAQRRGYATYQAESLHQVEEVCQLLDEWLRRRIDGLLLYWVRGHLGHPEILRRLERFPAALSVTHQEIPGFAGDQLVHDRLASIAQIVGHFVAAGRTRPAIVLRGAPEKAAAFVRCCREHGLADHPDQVIPLQPFCGSLVEDYRRSLEQHFAGRSAVGVDALFCTLDDGAIAAIRWLEERGLKVPEDVAVVGCNNIELAALWRPALASIDRRQQEMTDLAERMLFSRLEQPARPPQIERVPMRFLWRESAGGALQRTDKNDSSLASLAENCHVS